MKEKLLEAVKKAKQGKKRNFKQSVDVIINLKNIDLTNPENRINIELSLPHPPKKEKIIGFFADNLIPQVKSMKGVKMIRKDEIDSYKGNKKLMKKIARECHSFVAEAPLMTHIGKVFGQVLAPRGKMPKPVPPTVSDVEQLVNKLKNTIKISLKKSPVIQISVGSEDMKDEEIVENIEKVVSSIINELPRGKDQLKNIIVKLTMGKPEVVEIQRGKKV